MKKYSLQRLFILPFVILILSLAVTMGWSLYRAGQNATDAISQKTLADLMSNIDQATERQLHDTKAALRVITLALLPPKGDVKQESNILFSSEIGDLQERLWIASSLFPESSRFVCFGGVDGQFISVRKASDNEFLLRLRGADLGPTSLYRANSPNGEVTLLSTEEYEPRQRAWYINALKHSENSWSPIFSEARSNEPAMALTQVVSTEQKKIYGVVAAEMPLKPLGEFLRSVAIEKNGLAFIVERNGDLVASSTNDNAYVGATHPVSEETKNLIPLTHTPPLRWNVSATSSPLMREAWKSVQPQLKLQQAHDFGGVAGGRPPMVSTAFSSSLGQIEVAARVFRDEGGLDWVIVLATPRSNFWNSVNGGIYHSLLLGLVAILISMVFGFVTLRWALRDIRKLTLAAQNIGSGSPFMPLGIDRKDEIGQLAQSFQAMERNLRTDRLTNLLNRDSLIAQIEFMRRNALDPKSFSFAMLFIDLNKFKGVNDQFGHEQGDRVLIEVAQRLQNAVRKDDAVARFGGDEFVVYLHGVTNQEIATAVCQKIIGVLETPLDMYDGTPYSVGASVGGALYPTDGLDIETLLRVADSRMYSMKKFGGQTD
ncbi:sensor domain-containing diguanylate cyclase [Glaciimonas sp. PCH181]|uniref:sensor domain-containing diguanylate cyclase n=1 Tax=Glaciimonas sp. PCH181 TaxID=2133943 RepID=UPI001374A1AA|nr:sensor domain-containing diguanylate cyclase [Glaciimonas sp. PCH181]